MAEQYDFVPPVPIPNAEYPSIPIPPGYVAVPNSDVSVTARILGCSDANTADLPTDPPLPYQLPLLPIPPIPFIP